MSRPARSKFLFALLGGLAAFAAAPAAQAYDGSLVLFDGNNGTGASKQFQSSVSNLQDQGFNDRANSIFVVSGKWELCNDKSFQSYCRTFGPGLHNLGDQANKVSSLRPAASSGDGGGQGNGGGNGGFVAFTGYDGEGKSLAIPNNWADLSNSKGFNDSISSIAIFRGQWEICENAFFKGSCLKLGPGTYNLQNFNDRISSVRRLGN